MIWLLLWSIVTQHRDPGCENVRLRLRRIRIAISLAPLEPTLEEAEPAQHKLALG